MGVHICRDNVLLGCRRNGGCKYRRERDHKSREPELGLLLDCPMGRCNIEGATRITRPGNRTVLGEDIPEKVPPRQFLGHRITHGSLRKRPVDSHRHFCPPHDYGGDQHIALCRLGGHRRASCNLGPVLAAWRTPVLVSGQIRSPSQCAGHQVQLGDCHPVECCVSNGRTHCW